MKKILVLFTSAAMLSLVACGDSEADKKAARDKFVQDSTRTADSLDVESKKMQMEMSTPAPIDSLNDTIK
jgi:predicted outer membrane protein